METYLTIFLWLGLAEVLRRLCFTLIHAFTGPLSKVPGPFLSKFTKIPWSIELIKGNHLNSVGPLFEKYGSVVRITPTTVLVGDKPSVHKILIEEDLPKDPIMDDFRAHRDIPTLFLDTNKSSHKHARRLLSGGFSLSYLNGLEPLMQDCCDDFEKFLNSEIAEGNGTAVIDMFNKLSNLTFDVMSATSLGGSFNLVTSGDTKLKKSFNIGLKLASLQAQIPILKFVPYIADAVVTDMNRVVEEIITRRRAETGPVKRDIVQIILDANKADPVGYPEQRVRDELKLFMIAGSETTSTTVTVTLLQLVNNPEKLKILIEEIDKAFPSRDDAVTFAKTQDLPYLNAAFLEAMRLMVHPAIMMRYTTKPTFLGGYEIPAKTTVQPWPKAMMTDPQIWPDAASYVPERWLGEYKGAVADRKDIFSFSAGSRNCIGQQFALREMRIILGRLLRRYEISLIPGQSHERRNHSTQWFVQGFYNVGVKPRED